jgi:MFS family permease
VASRWALLGLALAMLLSSLGTSIANVALPTLTLELDASFEAVRWVVLAYLLAITASILVVGRLGDVLGRKRLLRTGLLLFTAASVVAGLAPSLSVVIAARVLQGLGAATMMALTLAFVSEVVQKSETGRAMGWLGTTSALGTALGPSLGGVLIDQLGWRAIFFVNLPLGLLALFVVLRTLPADRTAAEATRASFDLWSTLAVFRDPKLSSSLAANLLVSTVLMATMIVGPFYLSLALELDVGAVGLVMSVGPIVAALTGVPAGRLVDRFGAERASTAGLIGITVGALALAALPTGLHLWGYVVPIVVITAHYALFQAANSAGVMRAAAPDQRGVISGALSLSRNLGLIAGASVMGAVFAAATGASDVTSAAPEAVATGMRVTFALAAVLGAAGIATAAAGRALGSQHSGQGAQHGL